MTVSTFKQPNYTTQTGTAYPLAIDASIAVHNRLAGPFAPHENNVGSPAPDMTIRVDAGHIWNGAALTEKAAQTVTGFTAPSAGQHRIDRVVINATTGDALRVTGTAVAGSPSATPPAIPAGYVPCCQILIAAADTAITDSMITDERPLLLFGGTLAFGDGSAAAPSVKVGDEQNGLFSPAANTLGIATGGTEAARLDSSQRLLHGHTAAITANDSLVPQFQTVGVDNNAGVGAYAFSADANSARLNFMKSRNATKGSHTVVNSGDLLAVITASGSDGTNFLSAFQINVAVDGTPGSTDMPGRAQFFTRADGAGGALTEAMRIDRNQCVGIGNTDPSNTSTGGRLAVVEDSTSRVAARIVQQGTGNAAIVYSQDESASAGILVSQTDTAAGTGFQFLLCTSDFNGTSDIEFNLRGDGNAFADGSFTGSGADYQEYLESVDGLALRLGATVVLEGDKVRLFKAGDELEDIIGVVRPKEDNKNSAVIGNAAWNRWTGKYLTDDWGRYIQEDYTVYEWEEVVPARKETRKVQRTTKKIVTQLEAVIEGANAILRPREVEMDEPVFREFPLLNADGSPVLIDGKPATHREPVMEEREFVVEPEKRIKHSHADYKMPEGVMPPRDAKVTALKKRKLNPMWNKEADYVPRHDRPEWNLIGMLGQVQIAKGQPVNPRWRKMKDVYANVELWFIR